jgi:phenylalanyl-tRNA synthetase beta chain
MRISEAWLREWVNPKLGTGELAEQLTMAGLEVDSVEPAAPAFTGVVVAEILSVESHPDADKLRVCQVNAGESSPLQIVCGAPNARAGIKVPLATVGAVLPGDMKIKQAKLRGVASSGMLCAARELGLSDEQSGLMELLADAPVGADIREYLSLEDSIIEIDLTPNRGDCLGMEGVAREVGALTGTDLTPPEFMSVEDGSKEQFPVEVDVPQACPRYLGRVIQGINLNVETPVWMQERLRRGGIRSLGPVVDVTNYVLLELGQPMHAFDLSRLAGSIKVRYANSGEKLTLLDESEIELDEQTLLIADQDKPLALAGVMGGIDSGISSETDSLFLEVACFTPEVIAGRARKYGLSTDSAFRFERGVDPALQHRAMQRATQLLIDLVGGKAGPVVEVVSQAHLPSRQVIELRAARISRLLGFSPSADNVTDILKRLGMQVEVEAEGWHVTPPTFRFDVSLEADLIEEVGRVYGYNRIPSTASNGQLQMHPVPEKHTPLERLKLFLVDRDYQEAITYSFVEEALDNLIHPDLKPVALSNPISSELSVMRTSLWPGLIRAAKYNHHRQQMRIRLFEHGLNFIKQDNDLKQNNILSGLISGSPAPEVWGHAGQSPVDFFDIKGDVEALLEIAGQADIQFVKRSHPALHPGQSAAVLKGETVIGWVGKLHPELIKREELPEAVFVFELEMQEILEGQLPSFEKLSRFPSIRRDLSVVVEDEISSSALGQEITAIAGDLLKELNVFDVYRGKGIESGRKSIAFSLILQDSSRTLTDQDVDPLIEQMVGQLKEKFAAQQRK